MKRQKIVFTLLFLPLLVATAMKAQSIDQRSTTESGSNVPFDLNSKAQELRITPEQLNGILNSAVSNGDPLPDALTEGFFTGQAAGDNFGYSVASAGDVNGDGYDDIIVGAPFSSSTGKAYLYFGGLVPDYLPDAVIPGILASEQFGQSVSSAGDVNADGYDDLIIGAPNSTGYGTGRAYVIFGNSTMATYSVLILGDPDPVYYDDFFGISVSGAGDLNGDGYSDVVVGAPGHDIIGTDVGAAFVYFGNSSMDANYDLSLIPDGPGTFGEFGGNVSSAGDINGDGYEDLIVGATADVQVSVYLGGAGMNNIADLTIGGARGTTAGDVNGDGYSDIIVSDVGGAEIYFGGAILENTPDVQISGSSPDQFGSSVSSAGDVNGDGFSDLIIGAFLNDAGGTDAGRAYVYFGGVSMDNVKDIILTGENAGDNFGYSVASAGDVNGDGYSDLLVGAYGNDAAGNNAGRAYLYLNTLTGSDIPDEKFKGESPLDEFGLSVSSAGDVNGDGYTDLIIGAPKNDAAGTDAGRAYIYFGGLNSDNVPDLTLTGVHSGDEFGCSVSGAGDVNGDGYADVIVGAWNDYNSATYNGRAYIYFGGASMDNVADRFLSGEAGFDAFGYSVSKAGDVNADGFDDVIVGAYLSDVGGTDRGRAYIYLGGTSMDQNPDVLLNGAFTYDNFGKVVTNAGDVNSDGYDDVIVSAPSYNSFSGIAYVFLGGSSMDNAADVFLTGETAGEFGISISSAGDVNHDGYDDVVVGARGIDRAYIYYGGASMNNSEDIIFYGEIVASYFGCSVSSGDVNNDGYSDIVVGANNTVSGAGSAYVFFGGTVMDNVSDITMRGKTSFGYFGTSVHASGDYNKDGLSDIIVGASGNSSNSAYLFLSSSPSIKPPLKSVKDIPNDQGGFVRVRWNRSGYDVPGINRVEEYILQRSDPPGTEGFVWDYIVTVPAIKASEYSYVSPTPYDSMANTSGTFYFRVIARGTNPEEMWYSNIMYGHSVDNLAPLPPGAFYAQLNGSNIHLGWQVNTEPDFRDYYIYKSDTPIINRPAGKRSGEQDSPDAFTLIGTTTDTVFTDTSPLTGYAYYYISAYDIHDNASAFSSDSIMAFLSANIKIFFEGPYVGGQMSTFINTLGYIPLSQPFNTSPWNYTGTESVASIPANVTDWILVELRSTTTTVVERRAAFIKNDGTLVDLDGVSNIKFPTATAGDYYVVIIHRNHLSLMTSAPVTISFSPTLYDMRTDLTKAYGTNAMKSLGGGYYGAYTADTDGSGTVNAADRSNTWNQRNLSGYYGTDVDLSGTVNAADRSTVWNNRNLSTQVPTPVDGPVIEIVKGNNN